VRYFQGDQECRKDLVAYEQVVVISCVSLIVLSESLGTKTIRYYLYNAVLALLLPRSTKGSEGTPENSNNLRPKDIVRDSIKSRKHRDQD
jgi:hypothetical protein